MKVVAVLTSFNRKDKTLACLEGLAAAAEFARMEVAAVLVDDASTDGTAQAVEDRFSWVQVIRGEGDLYWSRGMHRGIAEVLAHRPLPGYVLWLNDDTVLDLRALSSLLAAESKHRQSSGKPTLVVGATVDRDGKTLTYSGQVRVSAVRRMSFRKVHSMTEAVVCETMNGNIVLVPSEVVTAVGNIDPTFAHAAGDIDYGLRVKSAGFPLIVAPGVCGVCSGNPAAGGFNDSSLSLRARWRHMLGRKGLPLETWLPLTRRHGGPLWPIYFVWPYLRVIGSGLKASVRLK